MTLTKSHLAYKTLWAICSGYFLIMLLLGLDRHWSFKTSIYDTGVFDQAIWSCLNGKVLLNTINLSEPINWLGLHFHPILFLFVPLYKLLPSPEWLILAQSLFIALTAFPIYKTALKLNYSAWHGLLWAISFLLNPFVLSAAIWDFHPVSMAVPVISLSIYYLISNRFHKLLLCIVYLLLCQEQFGILVIGIGISFYIINKELKKSLLIIFIGASYTILLFLYVFPALSPTGAHLMMSSEVKNLIRYNWLGSSLPSVIYNILANPLKILKISLIDLEGYKYILFLLPPYGSLLPILGMEILLIGAADFAANILSLNPFQRSINAYHSISLIPVIIVSAMIGLNRIRKSTSSKQFKCIALLTLVSFASLFVICVPHIFGRNSFWILSPFPVKDRALAEIQSHIPADVALTVQSNIGAHFTQRNQIYAYPNNISEADFIILKPEDMNKTLKSDDLRFIHHTTLMPDNYLESIKCLLASREYNIYFFKAPWLILSKNHNPTPKINTETVTEFLNTLETQWNIKYTYIKKPAKCSQSS